MFPAMKTGVTENFSPSEENPGIGAKILEVHDIPPEPTPGGDDGLVAVAPEPGPPPAEAAVGYDVMPAEAHEPHVVETLPAAVVIDEAALKRERKRAPDPGDVIGEKIEARIYHPFRNIGYRTVIVIHGTYPQQGIRVLVRNVIAPADVHAYRIALIHAVRNFVIE